METTPAPVAESKSETAPSQEYIPTRATVDLDVPIRRGNHVITSVSVREPIGQELEGVSLRDVINMQTSAARIVLPRVIEPPLIPHELAMMNGADLTSLAGELSNFLWPRSARNPTSTGSKT